MKFSILQAFCFQQTPADLENNGIDQKTETMRTKICKNACTMDPGAPLEVKIKNILAILVFFKIKEQFPFFKEHKEQLSSPGVWFNPNPHYIAQTKKFKQ